MIVTYSQKITRTKSSEKLFQLNFEIEKNKSLKNHARQSLLFFICILIKLWFLPIIEPAILLGISILHSKSPFLFSNPFSCLSLLDMSEKNITSKPFTVLIDIYLII